MKVHCLKRKGYKKEAAFLFLLKRLAIIDLNCVQ